MPAVRDLVSALNKLAHAAHHARPMPVRVKPASASPPAPGLSGGVSEGAYVRGGVEPPLDEVLRDPIVRALMRRDGLAPDEVRRRGRPPLGR